MVTDADLTLTKKRRCSALTLEIGNATGVVSVHCVRLR